MATDARPRDSFWSAARPLGALTAVWLTSAGHTMNFHEMNAAHGWISSEGYSLHSIYLFSTALSLPLLPLVTARLGSYTLANLGLALLAIASLINGLWREAPWWIFIGARIMAGIGAAFVIFAAPRLIGTRWERLALWAGIILPALGPPVIGLASLLYGWSRWEGAFFFEGLLAVLGLALLLTMSPPPERPLTGVVWPVYWPALLVACAGCWYVLHWGQLSGWLESQEVCLALTLALLGWLALLLLIWPNLTGASLLRFVLVGYAGFVQFFNASDMGVYGSLLINYSVWQRSWLVWSISVGAATALAVGDLLFRTIHPRRLGAFLGLLVLAGGMALARHNTLSWPFWSILNSVELNWFQAPQYWELAPARFMMGFGSAFVLLSALSNTSQDRQKEARTRPRLQEAQLVGGALSIGVLATMLLAGQQWEYAYASDRGYLQPTEVLERQQKLATTLAAAGATNAERQAEVLMYRAVNYQANNLLFADIYSGFLVSSLGLATMLLILMLATWISSPRALRE
jgi:hypothetical protein